MDILDCHTKATYQEDLPPGSHASEPDKSYNYAKLSEFLSKSSIFSPIIDVQENSKSNKDSSFQESKDFDSQRSEIEDTVELLCEQVETLQQLQHRKQLELQQIQRELSDANNKLRTAIDSNLLTLDINESNPVKPLTTELYNCSESKFQTLSTMLATQRKQSIEIRAKSRMVREYALAIRARYRKEPKT